MDCILKKEDFIFNKTSYLSFYECEINGFKLNIDEEDFTEEELVFSGKLLDLYSENLTKIIDACVKSETFKYCYPDEDVHSIEEKLGKPIIRRFGNLSVLTYTEHEFDEDHLLDIEIKGLYNEILEISIDG
jgi:hypothetical protein